MIYDSHVRTRMSHTQIRSIVAWRFAQITHSHTQKSYFFCTLSPHFTVDSPADSRTFVATTFHAKKRHFRHHRSVQQNATRKENLTIFFSYSRINREQFKTHTSLQRSTIHKTEESKSIFPPTKKKSSEKKNSTQHTTTSFGPFWAALDRLSTLFFLTSSLAFLLLLRPKQSLLLLLLLQRHIIQEKSAVWRAQRRDIDEMMLGCTTMV